MAVGAGTITSVRHTTTAETLVALMERAEDTEDFSALSAEIDELFAQLREMYSQATTGDERAGIFFAVKPLRTRRDDLASGRMVDLDAALSQMGVAGLRGLQPQVIAALDAGEDVVAVMATGAGKSLCYQAPALYRPGLTIVVSPLIALMSDQLRRLTDRGVRAGMLNSHQDPDEERRTLGRLRAGELRIVLCAPERLNETAFIAAVRRNHIGLLTVDEAHCVVEWGDDFRPEYQRIGEWRERMGVEQTLALTASATPDTAAMIAQRLGVDQATQLRGGVDRSNIRLDVRTFSGSGQRPRKLDELVAALRVPDAVPAIVYAGTRNNSEGLARDLTALGFSAAPYHAGMGAHERSEGQERFMRGDIEVMCATSAFGMGVDKADVRTVVHWQTPGSMEAYYQEIGRAGRDGEPSRAVMFGSSGDEGRLSRLNGNGGPSEGRVREVYAAWRSGAQIPPSDEDIDPESPGSLETALLLRAEALGWAPSIDDTMMIVAPGEGLSDEQLLRIDGWLQEAHERRWGRLDDILRFAHHGACRRTRLMDHFGDPGPSTVPAAACCDICDPQPVAARGLGDLVAAGADQTRWMQICEWRDVAAGAGDVAAVMTVAAMRAFADQWPRDRDTLETVDGVGPLLLTEHADDLLELTTGRLGGELSASERLHAERKERLVSWRAESGSDIDDAGLGRLARAWPQNRDDLISVPGMGGLGRAATRSLLGLCRTVVSV